MVDLCTAVFECPLNVIQMEEAVCNNSGLGGIVCKQLNGKNIYN